MALPYSNAYLWFYYPATLSLPTDSGKAVMGVSLALLYYAYGDGRAGHHAKTGRRCSRTYDLLHTHQPFCCTMSTPWSAPYLSTRRYNLFLRLLPHTGSSVSDVDSTFLQRNHHAEIFSQTPSKSYTHKRFSLLYLGRIFGYFYHTCHEIYRTQRHHALRLFLYSHHFRTLLPHTVFARS